MPDSNLNPYQPPKSSLERNFKVQGESGYRDGQYLIARSGFTGPRVCIKTGQAVEEDVGPMKHYMRPNLTWKSWFSIILIYGAIGAFVYLGIKHDIKINLYAALLMIVIIPLGVIKRKRLPSISMFCHRELTRKTLKNQKIYWISMYLGIITMNVALHFKWHPSILILVAVLFIVGTRTKTKPFLKSIAREGDYERFTGAHPNFLDALPITDELDFSIDTK